MAKLKQSYQCTECSSRYAKWSGQCPGCSSWNCLELEVENQSAQTGPSSPLPFESMVQVESAERDQISLEHTELKRVFGGSLVSGSAILLGGHPGVGKSTLALTVAGEIANRQERKVLYVCGEEAPSQVKLRAERLGVIRETIFLSEPGSIEQLLDFIEKEHPSLIVLDSWQTMLFGETSNWTQQSGAEALDALIQKVRQCGGVLLIIGHVTKEGLIAGPKQLEHAVDVVLFFESQGKEGIRILRPVKNRFASTLETGVFRMSSSGLEAVEETSDVFLESDRPQGSGQVLCPVVEGGRTFLVEVQALVGVTTFPTPTRKVNGYDPLRLSMILAVLEKRFGKNFSDLDIYVNIIGGLKVKDPGLDAALAVAILSSFKNQEIDLNIAVFGELGLAGELRNPGMVEQRIAQSRRLKLNPLGPVQQSKTNVKESNLNSLFKLFSHLGW